jgi:hypothetical protein
MTRYLIFGILGLTLSFFILLTAPDNSRLIDTIGLIVLAIGTGLYLRNIRLAGLLTATGLGIIAHVISAWWYNLSVIHDSLSLMSNHVWTVYIPLSIAFVVLLGLAIHATLTNKKSDNKLDQLNIPARITGVLTVLPTIIAVIAVVITWT